MTERGDAIIYCKILAPLNAPFTRRHNNYNYLNNREGAPLSFWDFGAPPNVPPPTQTPQYLTILMTERGGSIIL